MTARELAHDILIEVEVGGYASDLLVHRSRALDSREAGLAVSIVQGVLRYRAQIDFILSRLMPRPLEKLDPEVLEALRVGVFQLRYLGLVTK